jgi:hypothetical protein
MYSPYCTILQIPGVPMYAGSFVPWMLGSRWSKKIYLVCSSVLSRYMYLSGLLWWGGLGGGGGGTKSRSLRGREAKSCELSS